MKKRLMENSPKIMVIDDAELDNIIFKLVAQRVLANQPEIESCLDGQIAIDRLKYLSEESPEGLPGYIFLDLRMPVMDGWGFLRAYRKLDIDPAHQPKIYVLSSSINQSDIQRSQADPRVQAYLPKPIDAAQLKEIFGNN